MELDGSGLARGRGLVALPADGLEPACPQWPVARPRAGSPCKAGTGQRHRRTPLGRCQVLGRHGRTSPRPRDSTLVAPADQPWARPERERQRESRAGAESAARAARWSGRLDDSTESLHSLDDSTESLHSLGGLAESNGGNWAPVPETFRAILDDEADSVDGHVAGR